MPAIPRQVDQGSALKAPPLSALFCDYPFSLTEIHYSGDVYLCCPRYCGGRSIGNIFHDSPFEIWNSEQAVRIRQGVLDGSFSDCDHLRCPHIVSRNLINKESIRAGFITRVLRSTSRNIKKESESDGNSGSKNASQKDKKYKSYLRDIIKNSRVSLESGPKIVKLVHDDSCNLSCPSCRTEKIIANKKRQAELDRVLETFILPFLKDADELWLSGDGDPFASNHYRQIMKRTSSLYPSLRLGIFSNGVLLDRKSWEECDLEGRVKLISISVDASTAPTYDKVRRGGDFSRLMDNLRFIGHLRKKKEIEEFTLQYVVQASNYREMPSFVELADNVGADRVDFHLIHHWERAMTEQEFLKEKIWDENHSDHQEFLTILRDPVFEGKTVEMGELSQYQR